VACPLRSVGLAPWGGSLGRLGFGVSADDLVSNARRYRSFFLVRGKLSFVFHLNKALILRLYVAKHNFLGPVHRLHYQYCQSVAERNAMAPVGHNQPPAEQQSVLHSFLSLACLLQYVAVSSAWNGERDYTIPDLIIAY
jgi:hypothetical protein